MATAAERLANNMNFGAIGKATELRNRLLFTLGALIIFRLGTFLPIPKRPTALFSRKKMSYFGDQRPPLCFHEKKQNGMFQNKLIRQPSSGTFCFSPRNLFNRCFGWLAPA